MTTPTIICFGEVLWDLLPTGKIAGGAPMNVAFHLNNFGLNAKMLSRAGADELGNELLQFLSKKGINTKFVQQDSSCPTGTVVVTLDEYGSPSYEITQSVAWDYIEFLPEQKSEIEQADAFVYGSLAARNNRSRESLLQLLDVAGLKVFDVNLRTPFYSKDLLVTLLQQATIVKMNDEELELIGGWFYGEKSDVELVKLLKSQFDIDILIVTKGAKGAFLLDSTNEMIQVKAKKVTVKDTIGSGDSFLAGFLAQYLNKKDLHACLTFAAKTGALVATKKGGTPKINSAMVEALS